MTVLLRLRRSTQTQLKAPTHAPSKSAFPHTDNARKDANEYATTVWIPYNYICPIIYYDTVAHPLRENIYDNATHTKVRHTQMGMADMCASTSNCNT